MFLLLYTMLRLQAYSALSCLLPGCWNLNTRLQHSIASTISTVSSLQPQYTDLFMLTFLVFCLFVFVCVCAFLSSCAPYVCKTLWKTERVLDSLKPQLQRFASNPESARNQLGSSEIQVSVFESCRDFIV